MPPPPLLAVGAPCSSSTDENPIPRLTMSASSGLASARTFLLSRSRLRRGFRRAAAVFCFRPSPCLWRRRTSPSRRRVLFLPVALPLEKKTLPDLIIAVHH